MDKNILLGIIVIIFIIYLYYNIYDQFTSINENYENIVLTKYANNMKEKTLYEKILNSTVKTVKLIPKINYDIRLSDYEIYNNTNNLIVSILSKKKEENKEEKKEEPSIFETFYERIMSLKPITLNKKSLIEKGMVAPDIPVKTITERLGTVILEGVTQVPTAPTLPTSGPSPSGPSPSGPSPSELPKSSFFSVDIFFWFICFVVSTGVIFVIVQYGDKVFKSMGFNKIDKIIELTPTESSLVDNLSSPRTRGGNNIYYTGGYDINLYSE
jgi:hypothetical protein